VIFATFESCMQEKIPGVKFFLFLNVYQLRPHLSIDRNIFESLFKIKIKKPRTYNNMKPVQYSRHGQIDIV